MTESEQAFIDFEKELLNDVRVKAIRDISAPDSYEEIKKVMRDVFQTFFKNLEDKLTREEIFLATKKSIDELLRCFAIANLKLKIVDRTYFIQTFRRIFKSHVEAIISHVSLREELKKTGKSGQQAYNDFFKDILSDGQILKIVSKAEASSFDTVKEGMQKEFASIFEKHSNKKQKTEILLESNRYVNENLLKNFATINLKKIGIVEKAYFATTFREKFEKNVDEILAGNSSIVEASPVKTKILILSV